jgi:hypothetical protein
MKRRPYADFTDFQHYFSINLRTANMAAVVPLQSIKPKKIIIK